jgi:hypothetical protein
VKVRYMVRDTERNEIEHYAETREEVDEVLEEWRKELITEDGADDENRIEVYELKETWGFFPSDTEGLVEWKKETEE